MKITHLRMKTTKLQQTSKLPRNSIYYALIPTYKWFLKEPLGFLTTNIADPEIKIRKIR
jgi:hypothetical protein